MSTPLDNCGYMFTESYGPEKHYRLVLGFESLVDLQAAQDFVVSLRKNPARATSVPRGLWICKHGSYHNEIVAIALCGCERPTPETGTAPEPPEKTWDCVCGRSNYVTDTRCLCGFKRATANRGA